MSQVAPALQPDSEHGRHVWPVFIAFLRLGLTAFGGPVAHLGYFRAEFVVRRRWLSEHSFGDLVALCQFLPGPASSQVGMAIGLSRAGVAGALAAWAGFTLPSACLLIALAQGLTHWGNLVPAGALHGLKLVAVAVVAQAVYGMARTHSGSVARALLTLLVAGTVLLWPMAGMQLALIALAGLLGMRLFAGQQQVRQPESIIPTRSRSASAVFLLLFFALLAGLPLLARQWPSQTLTMFSEFYQTGSLIFGGGHVMLPLLQAQVIPHGWVSANLFLAGYGVTQAMPGPLSTFAAFLGAASSGTPSGWLGGSWCLVAIFLPSILLVLGVMPFWETLRHSQRTQAALTGVNAAVVGLLLAALYQPVWTGAVHGVADIALVLLALAALILWRLPPWLVVIASGIAGALPGLLH
ncbi:chromate efflux transporter [Silvimonas sp.]|uniref:chromate efflux transporter n=1 Tax=Silvimonas sp. TaxID=2650811 RepID=UPI00284101E6|nr:chromate efflux transporter [Silvimonas sp.]MDR3430200.1 chromate efflux transporter [Silvimonas sp.]